MSALPKIFRESRPLTLALCREQMTPLVVLFAISALLSISIEDGLQVLAKSDDNQRWILQISMGLWDLLEGTLLFLILSWGIPRVRALTEAHFQKTPFQENYLGSFMAEYLRMMASVLMWGLLLILPGFLRYCRLVFVPFIALFARPYREGKVDALELATELSRSRIWLIVGLMLGTTAVQMVFEFTPQLLPDLHILPLRALFIGIGFFISIWLYAVLYLLFEQAMEEYKWN